MFLKPVRKIRPSNRSITGKRSSLKTNSTHHFESALERDYITLIEFDADVESYTAQPLTIHYLHIDQTFRYTPDLAVYYMPELKRKPLLVEIKYEAELQEKKAELKKKFNAAKDYALSNDYEFRVVTEKEIRTDRLYNIKFLSRYRNSPVNTANKQMIMQLFEEQSPFTAQQVINRVPAESRPTVLHTLWQLLSNKTLDFDMQQQITMNTSLWKTSKLI